MSTASVELVRRGTSALRRSGVWWGIGIVALAVVSAAFWPSLEGTDTMQELMDTSKELMEAFGVQDLSTAAGYLDGQMYALMLPLLLSGLAIAAISAVTAGDEDAGRLELLHALPVSRQQVWSSRFASGFVVLAVITLVTAVVMAASLEPFSLDGIGVGRIVAATLACGALGLFHGAVAYLVAGLGGSRPVSAGIAIAVLVAGYVANFLLPLSDSLEGAQRLSPWHWAIGDQPVTNGVPAGGLLLLLAVTVGLVVGGTTAVTRRDIHGA